MMAHGVAVEFGSVAQVGVEGTGSYGAALARFLREPGIEVLEVDRPNRQERRRKGKTDTVDAIEAARAAQGQRQLGAAKTRDGNVEAIRALMVASRSARDIKIASLNQIRHLGFTAPEEIRQSLQGVSRRVIAKTGGRHATPSRRRPGRLCHQDRAANAGPAGPRARRRAQRTRPTPRQLLAQTAPGCSHSTGSATIRAAALLVAAGDNPDRLRSEAAWARLCGVGPIEASSGKTTRHRLNPGGTVKPTRRCGTSSSPA